MFMEQALTASKRATCYRRSVGAVLVQDTKVISTGYNGARSGQPHCLGNSCPKDAQGGCVKAVHAEINVLYRAPRIIYSGGKRNLSLYVTESPCSKCAREIVSQGVEEVYYLNEYRIRDGIEYMIEYGVKVFRMTTSGYIIDVDTDEIVNAT